ncbi:T9SS type A sorting domain-containing protein [Ekhidna sp.]|uniref:T9SS type A sorting domain-containing protein n=1 Tax=Ekhidna sp. TaxID=2608089 RepID=UPI003B502FC1
MSTFAHLDSDGDSLRYKLITPLQESGVKVQGYTLPSSEKLRDGGDVTFDLNGLTGDLLWDSPASVGSYSVAIKVEEWRKVNGTPMLIGFSVLDVLIDVIEIEEPLFSLEAPSLICLDSNQDFNGKVTIRNPAQMSLKLNFITDLNPLMINGINVSEWNDQNKEVTFTADLVELNLEIASDDLTSLGLSSVIFSVRGTLNNEAIDYVEYSTNTMIGVGCDENKLVSSVLDQDIFFDVNKDRIGINLENLEDCKVYLYGLDGIILKQLETKKNSKIDLPYPFEDNTVYLVSVHSKNGVITKKIVFSN